MCDASVWAHQRQALAPLAEVHIADPGMCDSLARMAETILAWAPERFAVAGHSMGGRIALEVVRRAPERVTALALLNTGYQPLAAGEAGERERAGRLGLLELARGQGMRVMGLKWLSGMIPPDRLKDAALIETIVSMIAAQPPELYEMQIRALLARPDATDLLPQIKSPTLVLCGSEDSWAPVRRHEQMVALIPGSTLEIIPDCGHMSTLEQPAAVSAALCRWLKASAGGAA